jgi:hypothetical protein
MKSTTKLFSVLVSSLCDNRICIRSTKGPRSAAPLEITDILGELRGMKDAPQLIGGEELLPGSGKGPAAKNDKEKNESPYKSNMEYLEDRFQLLALQVGHWICADLALLFSN